MKMQTATNHPVRGVVFVRRNRSSRAESLPTLLPILAVRRMPDLLFLTLVYAHTSANHVNERSKSPSVSVFESLPPALDADCEGTHPPQTLSQN